MRDAALQGLAIGFFDGVHLGHQAILRGASAALTFRNHPLTVLAPEKAPRLIMSCEERVAAIKACGVTDVTVLDFTRELADLSPDEFAIRYLFAAPGHMEPWRIFCGENWRFGKGGAGDADWLRARGIEVAVVPYAEYGGERISSSRIRRCLEQGEVADANAMLGRPYAVRGAQIKGKGLGGAIGCPTVNLQLSSSAYSPRLPFGVYEVAAAGGRGIANYGLAPTMGDQAWRKPVLEVHFLSALPALGADEVKVDVLRFIRPEKKFDSVDDLKRQIASDCAKILL